MFIRTFYLLGILNFLFASASFSQEKTNQEILKDTINETIIYEYDTVYLAPDTLHLTDTIIHFIQKPQAKKVSKKFNPRVPRFLSSHTFLSNFTPNSFDLKLLPFKSVNFTGKEYISSFDNKTGLNLSYVLQMNYNIGKHYMYSLGLGFTPFHEDFFLNNSVYSNTYQPGSSLPYDSLLINQKFSYNNYYNFFNFYLSFGRSWNVSKRIFVTLNISANTDILINYKAYLIGGSSKLPSSSAKKIDFSANIFSYIGYKINYFMGFYISPFYQYSFLESKKYPQNTFEKAGLGCGFKFFLK